MNVFGYAICREQGGEPYDYTTAIYEQAENLQGRPCQSKRFIII